MIRDSVNLVVKEIETSFVTFLLQLLYELAKNSIFFEDCVNIHSGLNLWNFSQIDFLYLINNYQALRTKINFRHSKES